MNKKDIKLYIEQMDKELSKYKKKGWGNFMVNLRQEFIEDEKDISWLIIVSFWKLLLDGKIVKESKGKVIPFFVSKETKRDNVQVFNAIKKLLKEKYE